MKKLLLTAVILCMACAIGCRKDKTPDAAASATSSDTTALLCHAVATTRVPVSLGNDGSVDSIFYIRHLTPPSPTTAANSFSYCVWQQPPHRSPRL